MRNPDARFDLSDTPDWAPRKRRARAPQSTEEAERELDKVIARLTEEDRRDRHVS